MSVFYVGIAVIVGLILLGGLFYISYMLETRKKRQAMIVSSAYDKITKYQRFLDVFPQGVLPKEIQLLLIEEIMNHIKTIKKSNGNDARAPRLEEQAQQHHKDIMKLPNKPPVAPMVKDLAAAKEVQMQFKNLFRLLSFIGKTRKQHRKTINNNIKTLHTLFVETGVNVHRNIAEQAAQQSKGKLALHHLNQAIGEYARVDPKKYADKIKALRQQIASMEKLYKNQPVQQPEQPAAAKPEKKDRGLDRMFDQQEAMKARRNIN